MLTKFIQWLQCLLHGNVHLHSKAELIKTIKQAASDAIINADCLAIIESALYINTLKAKDIMIPRSQMDVIDINDSLASIASKVIVTGHSRFPVIDGEISNMIGIFHSKDLLRYFINPDAFNLKQQLRHVYFVPEIKRLDGLMYEMRLRHSHLAIVVDEFTNVTGLITLEMIIEQIVGDIEDEYDPVEGERDIVELPPSTHYVHYRIKGTCKLNRINHKLSLKLHDERIETINGLLVKYLGRVPAVGEIISHGNTLSADNWPFKNISFEIISATSRKIQLLELKIMNDAS